MPKGPRGEKRPADVIGAAVKVMRIATGKEKDERQSETASSAAAELGKRGGAARARNLTQEQRAEIARKGAAETAGARQHILCRASEPHHADADASVHSAYERLQ